VANEQNLYFKQLFAILDKLGVDTNGFHHLSYGMVSLPDGSMKSREGNVVDADDLLTGMEDLAATEIRQRRDDWSRERIDEVKRDVALAAIRFFILKYDPRKNFTFNPEESLNFEGDTGPYLQYTHARICSILDKAPEHGSVSYEVLSEEEEQGLLRELSKFSTAVTEAGLHYKPSTLATQLLEIAHAFNTFYHACPVLQADDRIRDARLALVDATRQTLAKGLELLCITPLEEM
jgi:arginyl-tRNA synthetase